jgi:hypothetical protein
MSLLVWLVGRAVGVAMGMMGGDDRIRRAGGGEHSRGVLGQSRNLKSSSTDRARKREPAESVSPCSTVDRERAASQQPEKDYCVGGRGRCRSVMPNARCRMDACKLTARAKLGRLRLRGTRQRQNSTAVRTGLAGAMRLQPTGADGGDLDLSARGSGGVGARGSGGREFDVARQWSMRERRCA